MTVKIFRHTHFPEDLNDKFDESFKESDILVVENAVSESSNGLKEFFNSLASRGKYEHSVRSNGSIDYHQKLITFITNSKKQIEVEKPPVSLDELEKIKFLRWDSLDDFCYGNLERACEKRLEALGLVNEINNKRSNSLVGQLENIQKINENKSILALVEPSRGLSIYLGLKKDGFEVKQELSYRNIIFECEDQVGRRILFNKPYTKESLAKYFVCNSIFSYLKNDLGLTRSQSIEKSTKVAEKLSFEDIKSLSTYIGQDVLRRNMDVEATIVWLKKRGIEVADKNSEKIPYIT